MNIFESAARKKLRYSSDKGELTTEQLFELTLVNLDKVARQVNTELKSVSEESFINLTPDSRKSSLELKLEILKHVIAVKIEERDAAKLAVEKAARKKAILEALAEQDANDIKKKSREELLKELEGL